ncbi:hypothetical protein K504DRAFT_459845 [Pleomassaria siparia CBS 279.74]|uniref:Zona occludens toxin N-terminal domain-containing protein n=1 Tax=Pleomassaria siparia CBS 279.74 TaxID=1314801 RepID=A0A6G1JYR4_9PLEO|nr:hypothetical protein K504DRAFT_459845 [Pleomassaria siparia CBS 279.74]
MAYNATSKPSVSTSDTIEKWARTELLHSGYCDISGKLMKPINIHIVRNELLKKLPNEGNNIIGALDRIGAGFVSDICQEFPLKPDGHFVNLSLVSKKVKEMRLEFDMGTSRSLVLRWEKANGSAHYAASAGMAQSGSIFTTSNHETRTSTASKASKASTQPVTSSKNVLPVTSAKVNKQKTKQTPLEEGGVQICPPPPGTLSTIRAALRSASAAKQTTAKAVVSDPSDTERLTKSFGFPVHINDAATHMKGVRTSEREDLGTNATMNHSKVDQLPQSDISYDPDYNEIDLLMPDLNIDDREKERCSTGSDAEIRHAPLVSGDMIVEKNRHLLPQYGFLGLSSDASKLFLNTNIPFSAFICGVQGSGKSHTTSCVLENLVIQSKRLGRLEKPLSALVFSYGEYGGDGAGFNISEVASLAAPLLAGHPHARKVTVLYPPSNPGLAKLYRKVPNVTAIPYKLKPGKLTIGTMLTMMAVNASDNQPLYMAQVRTILRQMATEGNGFHYEEFKRRLSLCEFNPTQLNMLEMRLDLLESFLDLANTCPEPKFAPGEITIMDMSCPFVDTDTACILFKVGLEQYLQSQTPGKTIVLDEAHKYMLKTPSAIALNSYLLHTIRLQRHYGARVIISTQEPTLLTDVIALCSITVIHRFSSPEWFSAIKKHIPLSGQDQSKLLEDIEGLKTGTALVYSSSAVLGHDEDGSLIKGTGKMMRVAIRKRVTSDGGQSVLAV